MTQWTVWERVPGFDSEETIYEKKCRERGSGVGRILFNRPHRMNAFTDVGMREVIRAQNEANRDPSIGVIVVSTVGDHFRTGGDVQTYSGRPKGEFGDTCRTLMAPSGTRSSRPSLL